MTTTWQSVSIRAMPPKGSFFLAPAQARQTEVDFLLRRGRDFLAVEVKAGSRFSTPQLAGLRATKELPRLTRQILVSLGDRHLRTPDGIDAWPSTLDVEEAEA